MFALLWHLTKGRITREEFMDMDDWYETNVICRPDVNHDKPEKGYWPAPRQDIDDPTIGDISFRGVFFHPKRVEALRKAGMTDEQIEAKYRNWIKSMNR